MIPGGREIIPAAREHPLWAPEPGRLMVEPSTDSPTRIEDKTMPTSPLLSPARVSRWAAAPTILMALANVPVGLQPDEFDLPSGVLWLFSAVGVAGLVAAAALLLRHPLGPVPVLVIGAINAIGGLIVLAQGDGSGLVGVVLGGLAIALLVVPAWLRTRHGRTAVRA